MSNILLISKSFIICESLSKLLEDRIENACIEVASSRKQLSKYNISDIDLIIIDIENDILLEGEILGLIKLKDKARVIIIDTNKNKMFFIKSVKFGVDGYITYIGSKHEFMFRVNRVLKGKKYYDIDMSRKILEVEEENNLKVLTTREKEVLDLISEGLNNKEIGEILHISVYTVKKHISSILSKINLKNRKEAIIYMKDYY